MQLPVLPETENSKKEEKKAQWGVYYCHLYLRYYEPNDWVFELSNGAE